MLKCEQTGQATITRAFAEYLTKHRGIPENYFKLGDLKHRHETAATMGRVAVWERQEKV